MVTNEETREINKRTEWMLDEIQPLCKKMLDETTPNVLLNVMLNVGVDSIGKALVLLPLGTRGDALESVLRSIIENIEANLAMIDARSILHKVKEKK